MPRNDLISDKSDREWSLFKSKSFYRAEAHEQRILRSFEDFVFVMIMSEYNDVSKTIYKNSGASRETRTKRLLSIRGIKETSTLIK